MSAVQKTNDSRQARSDATKNALMRAAERLIAQCGMENVSISDIVVAAEQKNQSALQYHFTNLSGLIDAILLTRSEQTHNRLAELIQTLLTESDNPTVREICMLMVYPAYSLARENPDYQCYIKAFGHQLMLSETSLLPMVRRHGGGGSSGIQTGEMLRNALPHLQEGDFERRIEAAIRLCSASMYHHARQKDAFIGEQSELFLHSLVDAIVGLLSGSVSDETKALDSQMQDLS